jgi:hypothetical protein
VYGWCTGYIRQPILHIKQLIKWLQEGGNHITAISAENKYGYARTIP